MSLLWAESFDLYGSGTSGNTEIQKRGMVIVAPTLIQMQVALNVANARTGAGYMLGSSGGANDGYFYKQLDLPTFVCGQHVGMCVDSVPLIGALHAEHGMRFGLAGSLGGGINIVPNEELGFSVFNNTTFLGKTLPNQFVVGTWFVIEARVITGTGTAVVQLRFNGVEVLTISGFTFAGPMQRIGCGKLATAGNKINCRFDDWIIWDDGGFDNNDFLGERRCATSYVNANGTPQDWTASAGIAYQCIDETTPSDADYIEAAAIGNISEFAKESIGISTSDISAVVVIARALKSDAGASEIKIGIHSGAFVENSANKVLSTAAAYYDQIFQLNPNGNVRWTRSAVDAATVRFERAV